MSFTKSKYKAGLWLAAALIVVITAITFLVPVSRTAVPEYVYIDADDDADSLFAQVGRFSSGARMTGIKTLARHLHFGKRLHTGRYIVNPRDNAVQVIYRLWQGRQEPTLLTIPSVRTTDRLAAEVAKHLMLDSATVASALRDPEVCATYALDTLTISCLFTPNTYELYWDVPLERFLDRMQSETERFWTSALRAGETTTRDDLADSLALSRVEVITLASIVDEETSNVAEMPTIAGLYYNRLQIGMPLQADPTLKYAKSAFAAQRIYLSWKAVDSPYNTYTHRGLPPGPIRIPSVAAVDAVLNMQHHNYIYMCAREDFSGTHRFATNYAEHQANAKRYAQALNERGIE